MPSKWSVQCSLNEERTSFNVRSLSLLKWKMKTITPNSSNVGSPALSIMPPPVPTHLHKHVSLHACTHPHACTYAGTCSHAHTHMHVCTRTHSHTHVYTHNHQQELWPISPMSPLQSPPLQIPSRGWGQLQSLRLPTRCYPGPSSPPSSPGTVIIIKSKADCFTPAQNPHTIGRPNSPRIPRHTVKFRPAGPSHTLCLLYGKSSSPSNWFLFVKTQLKHGLFSLSPMPPARDSPSSRFSAPRRMQTSDVPFSSP